MKSSNDGEQLNGVLEGIVKANFLSCFKVSKGFESLSFSNKLELLGKSDIIIKNEFELFKYAVLKYKLDNGHICILIIS